MKKLAFPFLMLFLLSAVACGSLNKITPAQWDDEAIEIEVRAKIAEDVASETFDIGIEVDDGVVYLTGTADTRSDARKIGDAANDVEGVKRVVNRIRVE